MVGVEHGALINVKWRDGEMVNEAVHCIPYGDWNAGLPQTGP